MIYIINKYSFCKDTVVWVFFKCSLWKWKWHLSSKWVEISRLLAFPSYITRYITLMVIGSSINDVWRFVLIWRIIDDDSSTTFLRPACPTLKTWRIALSFCQNSCLYRWSNALNHISNKKGLWKVGRSDAINNYLLFFFALRFMEWN